MNGHGEHSSHGDALSARRIEALSDGIYAVAMTLLVIDLKLPDVHALISSTALMENVAALQPKFLAWVISFGVLGLFWFGHHRVFDHVRQVDGKLVTLNLLQLACVTLMPFSCAVVGEHSRLVAAEAVYAVNMSVLALFSWLTVRYVTRRPQLASPPISPAVYAAIRLRLLGLIVVSGAAVGLNAWIPGFGNCAFMLMWPLGVLSRRLQARRAARVT